MRSYSARMDVSPFLLLLTNSGRKDPYPLYERMLAEAPISDGPNGMVVLAGHADCARLLRDRRLSNDYTLGARYQQLMDASALSPEEVTQVDQRWLVFRDPPDQTRVRRLVAKSLVPRFIDALRPRVQELVDEVLEDAVDTDGNLDFVDDFAFALPMRVITELLGVPQEDCALLHDWCRTISFSQLTDVVEQRGAFDPNEILPAEEQQALAEAQEGFNAYLDALIDQRRAQPGDDMLSQLITNRLRSDELSTPEVRGLCQLLLGAGGVDTTSNMIASGMLSLLRNPTEFDRLREDLSMVDTAVEEILRYEPPVQFVQRFALEDLDVAGRTLRAGRSVILLFAAANRDPKRFIEPQRFDVGRTPNPHLSFGASIHVCSGARLARVIGQVAFARLAERLVMPELLDDTPPYKRAMSLRSLKSLPIRVQDLKPFAGQRLATAAG